MVSGKQKYLFNGSVLLYDKVVADRFSASTFAASEKKARANIAHQYKQKNQLEPFVPIRLDGKMSVV